jgi:TPR repeat protein
MRRFWIACILAALWLTPAAAQNQNSGDRHVALVIGNFAYQHVPRLANPGNDATLIASNLHQIGFTLVGGGVQENVDKASFDKLVQEFGRAIQGADVALFYYAGHGMQVDGKNWLVPIDANPTRPQDLAFQMEDADLVLQQMNGAGTRLNLVVLDACRNNPFTMLGSRAVQGGLAQMQAPEGTMISFATQPGNVAQDGSGTDGPYATALAASMRQPGLDIFHVFNRVGLMVKRATDGAQQPWVSSSPIDGEFYFTPTETASDTAAAVPDPLATAPAEHATEATRTASAGVHLAAPQPGAASTPVGTPAANTPAAHNIAARLTELRSLAAQDKPDAEIDLGLAYAKAEGVTRDDAVARQWFERAAAHGVAQAQYLTGAMLERGRGGARSYAEALQWYRRAADQGYAPAEVALGRFYGRGLGVPRDVAQRTTWYRRAADHGNPIGQWATGNFYQNGDGVERDMTMALAMYVRAAKHGFIPAEARLGWIYQHGIDGVPRDDAEALHWYRLAAAGGSPIGLNGLAAYYRRGTLVPRDYAQAMRLFRQAADKGSPLAAYNLGLMYANGHGVPIDRQQARAWFEKAAAGGNQPAIDLLVRQRAACEARGLRSLAMRSGESDCGAPR